jgi:hypothetical protein
MKIVPFYRCPSNKKERNNNNNNNNNKNNNNDNNKNNKNKNKNKNKGYSTDIIVNVSVKRPKSVSDFLFSRFRIIGRTPVHISSHFVLSDGHP